MLGIITPSEIVKSTEAVAVTKVNLSTVKTLALSFLAGVYISMGGTFSLLVGFGFPGLSEFNPALTKLLSGAMFPIGLMFVVFAGAELFTGNNAMLMPALLKKQINIKNVLRNWSLVYIGNFLGALFFTYIFVYYIGLTDAEPWHGAIIKLSEAKVSMSWLTTFIKGIGANWFVCLAIWFAMSSKSSSGKIFGLWFPVACFVVLGYEHCIANMFFIPLGMFNGADISIGSLFINNLIPATLGNVVGGALFVGGLYGLIYKEK